VNRFDLLEDVAAILESMLWVKRADEMVGLKKKIALMILMHLALLVWLLVKFGQRLSKLARFAR
jgi:cell division protein FtsX